MLYNYIWTINSFISHWGVVYIGGFTVVDEMCHLSDAEYSIQNIQ